MNEGDIDSALGCGCFVGALLGLVLGIVLAPHVSLVWPVIFR